jgi:hypothetical protein
MGARFQTCERVNHCTRIVDHDVLDGGLVKFGGEVVVYAEEFGS